MNKKDITILVVGTKDRTELVGIIKSLGHENIIETKDGTSAWNLLKNDNSVDMVFADWHIGQFDGVVLSKLMMSDPVLRSIPTILISSTINRQMALDAGNAGVCGLLVKPFSESVIKNKIEILFEIQVKQEAKAEELLQSGTKYFEEGNNEKALE
jgi:two-component system chemotaxis response regulator CheY